MNDMTHEWIVLNGIKYIPEKPVSGTRAVVVVDRGWIFAGDVTEENGRIRLSRARWVFRWESIGFNGAIDNPSDERVDLRPIDDVDIPAQSEVFRVPVADDWGL